jgi:hydroxymethylpyrimidine pyrophosphatase-like HAD family hydrolase
MPAIPAPVLITTDLDRTLIFSPRAIAVLGGALPSDPVETSRGQTSGGHTSGGHTSGGQTSGGQTSGGHTDGELCRAARDALATLPAHALICVATSRSISRLRRLRLPFAVPYAIAANGGVVLVDGEPDPEWASRIGGLVSRAAPAAEVRAVLTDSRAGRRGSAATGGSGGSVGPPWLQRLGDEDDMCCLAIVDPALLPAGQLAEIARRCLELGWQASLIDRKLYAFPAGFGKEQAAAFVAEKVAKEARATPRRLAAGDTEHDRLMLADADLAWVPAGSDLAARAGREFVVTSQPGHAAAAQITQDWLDACAAR